VHKLKDRPKAAKVMIAVDVLLNLGLLFVFKYLNFTAFIVGSILKFDPGIGRIALPIGISFFTFQAMSYVVDVYRGKGEVQKNILKPHHQLFSAYGDKMKNKIHLTKGDARVQKYLRGEEIECETGLSGWCAVIYEGVALGGGKISGGRVKNHYPKGLRNN
jgi:hypothetical protein